jgi:hypothetical protein
MFSLVKVAIHWFRYWGFIDPRHDFKYIYIEGERHYHCKCGYNKPRYIRVVK